MTVISVIASGPQGSSGAVDKISFGTAESARQTGNFNLTNYASVQAMLNAAIATVPAVGGVELHFLPGTFPLTAAWSSAIPGLSITGSKSAKITSPTSGTTAAITLSGADCSVDGLRLNVVTPVQNQPFLLMSGERSVVKNTLMEVEATLGTGTHFLVDFGDNSTANWDARFDNNHVMPNRGTTVCRARKSSNLRAFGNKIGGKALSTTEHRECFRVFWTDDSPFFTIADNQFIGLGESTNKVTNLIYHAFSTGQTQHGQVFGNKVYSVACDRLFRMIGGKRVDFVGNYFGGIQNMDVGIICLEGSGGDASGNTSTIWFVDGNTFDSWGTVGDAANDGVAIYVRKSLDTVIQNNWFYKAQAACIGVDRTNTVRLKVVNNHMLSKGTGVNKYAIVDNDGGGATVATTGWTIRGNEVEGSTSGTDLLGLNDSTRVSGVNYGGGSYPGTNIVDV